MSIRSFVDEHYRHFNAGTVARASASLVEVLDDGGRVFLTLAGAMSTAEIGRSLADMIRSGHIAAISCTGANLEEDVFNLVAHDAYVKVANHEDLSPEDEAALFERKLNRVTDVCIPEDAAIRAIEHHLMGVWRAAQEASESLLPHEHLYRLLRSGSSKTPTKPTQTTHGCWPPPTSTSRFSSPAGRTPRWATSSPLVVRKGTFILMWC